MSKRELPSPDLLRQLIRYDAESGQFFWKERSSELFGHGNRGSAVNASVWNRRYAGTEALTASDGSGYRIGSMLGHMVRAHRVAWSISFGSWPSCEIDHINGIRSDNRIANLREATSLQNKHNSSSRSGSTSSYRGVSKTSATGRWQAQIAINGVKKYIGMFDLEEDAALAYDAYARTHFGVYARLNFPAP